MDSVREYYRLITECDIGDVARDILAGRITQETPKRLLCDCPNHASQSHRSLNIMIDKQGWYCFGCAKGGDVLQLVEFVQSGTVTVGKSGPMPDSHRNARDFLAARAGLPPLGRYGLTPDGLASTEEHHAFEIRVKDALTALARYYHARLREQEEVIKWLKDNYAISDDTIDDLLIGFADNTAGTVRSLMSQGYDFTKRELAATGAFWPTGNDDLVPFFDRRITFPYWSRGRINFMIGRRTPWTPANNFEAGKYKKLPVHDEHQHSYIARCIDNAALFNEDCLLSKPSKLIITEGVTDCIALMQQGFDVVSPVTVRIRTDDWERLIPKLRDVDTIYICQDNELSQAGLKGALQTARTLAGHGIDTRLVCLPLDDDHLKARRSLEERFGISPTLDQQELTRLLKSKTKDDADTVEALLAHAKTDVNEYFHRGHSREDFEGLLRDSKTPVDFGIESLKTDGPDQQLDAALTPLLLDIGQAPPMEQARLLKSLQTKLGRERASIAALRQQLRQLQKDKVIESRSNRREEKVRTRRSSGAPAGSCRARIDEVLIETELQEGSPDYAAAAQAAFDWFSANGAMFFRTRQGEPVMCYNSGIYWMDSGERGRKRVYSALMYEHTGQVPTSNGGRTFFEVLSSLATVHGKERDQFSWLHTDVKSCVIWFNLNNERKEIVKISPEGVQIIPNGNNGDSVILTDSRKMQPVQFLVDADLAEADRLLKELLIDNITCDPGQKLLIITWLCSFLLMDFSSTKPMTRFEGPAGSGKTTASKLISTLLYGAPQHKKSTDAANYTDGSKNPLIVLDNIEVKQMTDELVAFMLTSITGVAREKRRGGTDAETIVEQTKCLINTTGIEPLCGDLTEIMSRTFTVNFDVALHENPSFIESRVIAEIQQHRDLIMSAIFKRTSHILALMQSGAQSRVMELINSRVKNHDKRRCNEYLSIMYLMLLAGAEDSLVEEGLRELREDFVRWLELTNETSRDTARLSNPIAEALQLLFKSYQQAVSHDQSALYGSQDKSNYVATFTERYLVAFESTTALEPLFIGRLFPALKRLTKDFGLSFPFKDPGQLAKRMYNDQKLIEQAGIDITRVYDSHRKTHKLSISLSGLG